MNIKFILINIYILEGRVIKFGGASILLYRNVCSLNLTNAPYLCNNLYNNTVWGTRYVCTKEDLRIVRTRKLLSNTLLDMMEEESIEKISVIDLCNKAMVNRATFYAHFEDKYHLLTFALEELKDDLYKKFTKDTKFTTPTETLNSMIVMAVDFFFDKHNHIANIIRFNRNGKVISTIQDSIAHSIKYQLSKYKDTYEIKMPLQILSTFVAGGMINTVLWCVDNPGRYTYEEFISYATCPLAERCFVKK